MKKLESAIADSPLARVTQPEPEAQKAQAKTKKYQQPPRESGGWLPRRRKWL
jgi:hypothetical protein